MIRVSDYVADYVIREDCPSAANLAWADKLGRALRGDLPKQPPKTEGDKQRAKRRAVKVTRRKRFRW